MQIKELEQHRRVLKEQKELAESTNDYKEKVLKDKNTRIGQLELEVSNMVNRSVSQSIRSVGQSVVSQLAISVCQSFSSVSQ